MKKLLKSLFLTAVCIFVSSSFVFANTTANSIVDTYNLKFGLDVRSLNYEEPDNDVELDGPMYGISGEFIYHGISNMDNYLMASLDFEALGGSLDYKENSKKYGSHDNWLIETRGLIGYEYFIDNANIITPFTGIGYRYFINKYYGTGGYEREIQYWYAPIGIKSWGSISNNWTCGMPAEIDLFLDGTVKSHRSDVNSSYNDPELDYDSFDGHGVLFSVHFTKDFPERGHSLSFKPYVRYWNIDKSESATLTSNGSPVRNIVVPENETTSYGLRLRLSF